MASLALLSVPIDGTEFLDLDSVVLALDNWAVKAKFVFRTERRDATRASWVCGGEGCDWHCRATIQDEMWVLSIDKGEHYCAGSGQRKYSSASKKDWLDGVVSRHLLVTTRTTPQEILDLLRIQFAEEIDYKRAQECRLRLLDQDIGKQRHSFQLLPAYKLLVEAVSPAVHIELLRDCHDRFERVFICPAESRTSFALCRRLVVVDGTFLKARFILTLLLAVGIDANGEGLILAWAVVESENQDSWSWFFQHLRWAIPEVSTETSTLLSNRDKGLLLAERVLGPLASVAWCCHHVKENFVMKFGRALQPFFWGVARATTPSKYHVALEKLRDTNTEAAAWIEAAEPEKWAEALYPGRRYGQDTSNIVESQNSVLKLDRELPIVALLDSIWHRVMEKRAERLASAQALLAAGRVMTPAVEVVIAEGRQWAQGNRLQLSSPTQGRVVQPNGSIYLVDLTAGTCSCRQYQANGIPCGHAICLILRTGLELTPFLPPVMSPATWEATYATPMLPIDISGLGVTDEIPCYPPITRVPRGRPKKERFRKEDGRRSRRREGGIPIRTHCSTCGETGHNRRKCRRPHE